VLLTLLQSQAAATSPETSGGVWAEILRPRRRIRQRLPELSVAHVARVACLTPRIAQRVRVYQVHVAFVSVPRPVIALRSACCRWIRSSVPLSLSVPIVRFRAVVPVAGPMRVGGPAPISDAEAIAALLLWRR
jgi:hypothetical protein